MHGQSSLSRKSVYRLWLFYAVSYLVILALMVVFGVIVTQSTYRAMRQDAESRNLLVLGNACSTIEQKLYELDVLTDSIAADNDIMSFSKVGGSSAHIAGSARLLWDEIRLSYLQNRDMLESTSLYFSKNDVLLQCNDIFLSSDAYYASLCGDDSQDFASKMDEALHANSGSYVLPVFIDHLGTELIPYVRQMPSTTLTDRAKVIYMIKKNRIDELFLPLTLAEGCVFMADRNGSIFYTNGPSPQLAEKSLLMSKQSISHQIIDGRSMIVCKVSSAYSGWQLVSILPAKSVLKQADYVKSYTFLMLALTILLGIVAATVFARNYTAPWARLKHILDSGDNVELPSPISNAIMATVTEKAHESNRMQQTLERQKHILERTTITHMLSGGYLDPQSGDWPLPVSITEACQHQVILVRAVGTDDAVQGSWRLVSALRNSEMYYCVQMSAMDAAIIVSSASPDPAKCIQQTEELIQVITETVCPELELSLQLFVGGVHPRVDEIALSYEEAGRARTFAATVASGVYYYRAEISGQRMYTYSLETERKLIQSAINGSADHCTALLGEIFDVNFVRLRLCSWTRRQLMSELTGTYLKIKQYLNSEFDSTDLPFDCDAEPEEFFALYKAAILQCCQESVDRHARHADDLCCKIDAYMQQQYQNPMLSLSMIAQHFGMGESTFSRLFKTLTGDTFTGYLENLRMQKAVSLMVQTNDTIGSIAEKVGYNSIQTFSRAFKRYYSLSPDAWRKDQT